jgi:hypothetical protein
MQTIREAKIIVHLEQGKVELKAPDISAFLAQQERQLDISTRIANEAERLQRTLSSLSMPAISPAVPSAPSSPGGGGGAAPGSKEASDQLQRQIELTKQLQEATEKLTGALQRAAATAPISGGSGSSGGGGGGARGGTYEERDRERILKIMQDEERAIARLRSSMSALGSAAQQAGEGFFRFARAGVLLGESNKSLESMVKNLAQVQAYWDLFAGMLSIVQALANAKKALAAAQAAYTLALAGSTLATQAFTAAVIEATAALLAFLTPFIVIGVIIGAAILAAIAIWDALTVSESEAAEAAKQYTEAVQKGTEVAIKALQEQLKLEEELESMRRSMMSDSEQQVSLAGSRAGSAALASGLLDRSSGVDPAARKQFLEAAREASMQAAKFANEEMALAMKRRDAEVDIRQEKIKQIEAAEKALQTAQRQKQIEDEKLRSFQAQVGALAEFERTQLINIRNRLRAGQDINQFEEEFLAEKGGEGGRRAADSIRAKRAADAGFGVDFWEGTAGAGAAKDMADASDKVAKALEELAKLLGDANSGAAAKAKYEAEIKAIDEVHAKELEAIKDAAQENIKTFEEIVKQLKELQQAVLTG